MILSVIKGCYPYFSVIALIVIIWRIRIKAWTRKESLLLAFFLAHLILEILQIVVGDGKWSISRRYLLPVAPLLFVWTAYGASRIYHAYRVKIPRGIWMALIAALVLFSLYDGIAPSLKGLYSKRKKGESEVIAMAAPVIRQHYTGVREDAPPPHKLIYRSPFRPVVWCKFPAVGLMAGGRSEPSPFEEKPDFYVLPDKAPYPTDTVEIATIHAQNFKYIIYQRRN